MSTTPVRYKAITSAKNEDGSLTYNGKTYGVRFENGVAIFDDVTVDPKLGWTAAQIADKMERDFGYEIQRLNMDGTPYTEKTKEVTGEVETLTGTSDTRYSVSTERPTPKKNKEK